MHYHQRKLRIGQETRGCNQPFVYIRCPACGNIVGLVAAYGNPLPEVFCSGDCADAVDCRFELLVRLAEESHERQERR